MQTEKQPEPNISGIQSICEEVARNVWQIVFIDFNCSILHQHTDFVHILSTKLNLLYHFCRVVYLYIWHEVTFESVD